LLESSEHGLKITATDLETQIVSSSEVDVVEQGCACVSAKKLYDVVKSLPDDATISASEKDGKLIVKAGRSRFSLATIDPSNFPVFDTGAKLVSVELDSDVLRYLIDSVDFASAKDDVRYYLNGVFLTSNGGTITAVASNGHRLAKNEIEVVCEPFSAIVPSNAVASIKKTANGSTITLSVGERSIAVSTESENLEAKLIEGKFPDFNRVIPAPNSFVAEVEVNRRSFVDALKRASILSEERTGAIVLSANQEAISITSANSSDESASESVDVVALFGEQIERVGFNVNYLIQAISSVACENVKLMVSDKGTVVISSENFPFWKTVIMPMRV
jgi:DNA polymerase-3 subunit beta